MFLKDKNSGDMVDISDMSELTNLFHPTVLGRFQCGEEVQEPQEFNKHDLMFLSGEELPQCWHDPNYRKG